MSKYEELVKKYSKEPTAIELAKVNNGILQAEMEAKVMATKAEIIKRESRLKVADINLEKAHAYITDDINYWESTVENTEKLRNEAADELNDANLALEKYRKRLLIFKN